MLFVAIIALVDRYRLERLRHEFDELRVAADARDSGSPSALIASPSKDSI
jgi:hypothetical protein